MSLDKSLSNRNNKKKKNTDLELNDDLEESKLFSDNHIFLIQKPSTKFPKAKYICKICPFHIADKDKALKHCNDIMHKKNCKRTHTRNMMQYLNAPTNHQLEAVNNCLNDTLGLHIFITEAESSRRKSICKEMNEIACEIGVKLTPCGSIVTGLSIVNFSDVNLYLDLNIHKVNNISYLSQLDKLSNAFTEKLHMKTEIKLDKRNCGLFCMDSQNVLYHVTSTTHMCQLTSELIEVYMKIDSRAEKLIKLLRYFANQAFIDRAMDGLFPAQVFPLLVIFYLQQLSVPILPNLHKLAETNIDLENHTMTSVIVIDNQVRYLSDIATIKKIWTPPQNSSNLAELWVGLLRFYAIDFDTNTYMVSVRCVEPVLKIDRNIVNKRLAVDDPFDFKRNLLFSYNALDVMDFFNDQLQGCYIYFAIPQLVSGPAFSKVSFIELTMESLPIMCLVKPTFTRNDFTGCIRSLENEFHRLYITESDFYDVSKWPVKLFVKLCLSSILTSIFDSRLKIDSFISLMDLKGSSYFAIGNYSQFKDHAINLSKCVFQDFSDYFEATGSWMKSDINCKDAIEVIKKSTHKFITESLNITINDDENEDDDFEMHEMDSNEVDIEEAMEDLCITVEDGNDETDAVKPNNEKNEETKNAKYTNLENWKIPIAFKLINIPRKGILESSNDHDVYNEEKVQSITEEQIEYNFMKIPIHKQKLEIICSLCSGQGHRKEFCKDAIPRFQELKHIRDVSPGWLLILKQVLSNKFQNTLPTQDRLSKHNIIFAHINKIIADLYPNSRPQMFGSSHNGFMTRASDIDICLEFFLDDKRQNLSNKEITTRLKSIGRDLKKFCTGIDVSYVLSAKVPIIKFFSKDGIQGDISINNSLAIQNTKMLKLYAELYPDMKGLGNLLKFVSKSCEIGDASQGTLSSYAYIIMLIHFLQKRGLLPVLQELYEGDVRPSHIIDNWDAWYQSSNEIISKFWKPKVKNNPIEYLWLDFFYYFAVEFDIDREVISIKQSKPLFKIDKNWQMSYMAIEDPFDLNHNLSGSLSLDKCRYILQCFAHILKLHSDFGNVCKNGNSIPLLMEPAMLRPPFATTSRTCFKCNKPGHVARDCTENQYFRPLTSKNGCPVQRELPNLASPLILKESRISNRFFAVADNSGSVSNISIPMKTFNGGLHDYSVIPISLIYGDKSIVIPMLMAKDGRIYDTLNNLFKNEEQNIPMELIAANNRMPETLQRTNIVMTTNIPCNYLPNNQTASNSNMKKNINKKLATPVQNNRGINNDVQNNQQFAGRFVPSSNQNYNQSQFLPNTPNNYNMGGNNRAPGYNNSPGLQYGPGMPRQFMGGQKYFPDYPQQQQPFQQQQPYQPYHPQMQQNSRQMNPGNVNNRYQHKGNK